MVIQVKNIVETKLSFSNSTYKAFILKDTPKSTVVLQSIEVKYGDADPNDLTVTTNTSKFSISYKGVGVYQINTCKLLKVGTYRFKVTATLTKHPKNYGTALITIEVDDFKRKVIVHERKGQNTLAIVFSVIAGVFLMIIISLLAIKIFRK